MKGITTMLIKEILLKTAKMITLGSAAVAMTAAVTTAAVAQEDDAPEDNSFILSVLHADKEQIANAENPYDLYRDTELSMEVDALDTPTSGGFEYWPFRWDEESQTHPYPYPDHIQWGFSAGGETAQKCMKLSWHIWRHIQDNPPAELTALMELDDAPRGYFHWNNDYTEARSEGMGFVNFWHYSRPSGLLKWISNTTMAGTCMHPTMEAIAFWADCETRRIEGAESQCRGHR